MGMAVAAITAITAHNGGHALQDKASNPYESPRIVTTPAKSSATPNRIPLCLSLFVITAVVIGCLIADPHVNGVVLMQLGVVVVIILS